MKQHTIEVEDGAAAGDAVIPQRRTGVTIDEAAKATAGLPPRPPEPPEAPDA